MDENTLGNLDVSVEISPDLAVLAGAVSGERKVFASELLRQLNDLRDDLGIPAKITLSIKPGPEQQEYVGNPFRVFINGKNCRLPVAVALEEKKTSQLARFIADGIQQSLELFIDPALSSKIRESWSSDNGGSPLAALSDEQFHEVLSLLVSRGFSIERLENNLTSDVDDPILSTDICFELAIAGIKTTRIKVFLKKGVGRTLAGSGPLEEKFAVMQERLFEDLGLMVPQVVIAEDDSLKENEFRLQLNDIRFSLDTFLGPDEYLVDATRDKLSVVGIACNDATNPEHGSRCALIRGSQEDVKKVQEAGYRVSDRADFIVLTLAGTIRKNAGNLLTGEIVKHCAKLMEETYPELVTAALARFHPSELAQTLRILLDEEIPIRDMRSILESLLAVRGTTDVDHSKYFVFHSDYPDLCPVNGKAFTELGPDDYSSCVRMALRRHISHRYARSGETLIVYVMSPTIEAAISNSEQQPLSEGERTNLIKAIFNRIGKLPPGAPPPVILTTVAIRRRLRRLIEKEFPRLTVLCNQELLDVNIQSIGQIEFK